LKEKKNINRNEAFYHALIKNSHDAISLSDEYFNVTYLSPSTSCISGWTFEERAKVSGTEQAHPDDIEKLRTVMKEVLSNPGEPIPIAFRRKHKDGHYMMMEGVITNMLADENVKGIVSNLRDITLYTKCEDDLRKIIKEVSDYKYALDESSIVAITDQHGIITQVNHNFCKISKYSAEELIGQDHRIINSGHHSKEFIRNLWITIANGKIWRGELKNKAKDGTSPKVSTQYSSQTLQLISFYSLFRPKKKDVFMIFPSTLN